MRRSSAFRSLRPFLLLSITFNLFLLTGVTRSVLYGQTTGSGSSDEKKSPTTDPALRLQGDGADSITGGMPTVMVRRSVRADKTIGVQNTITTDAAGDLFYLNLSYSRAITSSIAIGGEIGGIRGPLLEDSDPSYLSFGAEANYYFDGTGPQGYHLDVAQRFYSFDGGSTMSTTVGYGQRHMALGHLVADYVAGVEYFFDEISALPSISNLVFSPEGHFQLRVMFRLGFAW